MDHMVKISMLLLGIILTGCVTINIQRVPPKKMTHEQVRK